MSVESPKANETAKVLCYLTDDWKSRKSEGPRSKGETLSYRFGVSVTPNSWALTEFREGLAINQVYATSFADLCPSFKTIAKVDPVDGMRRVVASLQSITGKNFSGDLSKADDIEKLVEASKQVDAFFEVDYAIHDNVRERVFGDIEEEE